MIEPELVDSREKLVTFVDSLLADLQTNPDGWENATLERYLDALSRYLSGLDGWCKNNEPTWDAEVAQWRLFAVALSGAVVYE